VLNQIDGPVYGAVDAGRNALNNVLPKAQTTAGQLTGAVASFLPAVIAPETLAGRGMPTVANMVRQSVVPGLAA
jgi:hypothetical protein